MNRPMVKRDTDTFVALAKAVALARAERAIGAAAASDLSAALVAGILTGCMDVATYGRVHDTLAALLEKAFQGPVREVSATDAGDDEPLGAYLEVVGEAWDEVGWDSQDHCGGLQNFVRRVFDLGKAQFGEASWFRAPLKVTLDSFLKSARAAGLLVVSVEGEAPAGRTDAVLRDPALAPAATPRVVLGWGERRAALDLVPSQA